MLYTVISPHDIFAKEFVPTQHLNINGGRVEYTLQGNNKIITSLFSTDPKLYLDKRYTPGRILDK
ncbi:MAG: hypothetical protein IJ424_03395 [Oscillospiraceae bacterium]|nr:hypothetical protein [Oscillospiraceae bacterium]